MDVWLVGRRNWKCGQNDLKNNWEYELVWMIEEIGMVEESGLLSMYRGHTTLLIHSILPNLSYIVFLKDALNDISVVGLFPNSGVLQ